VDKKRNHLLWGAEETDEPDPIYKVWALQELYFPSLTKEHNELLESIKDLVGYIYKQGLARHKDQAEWIDNFDDTEMKILQSNYYIAAGNFCKAVSRKVPDERRS
jgi:hypothetical protein